MKKNQTLIGIILLAAMVLFGFYLNTRGANLPMSLITGLGLGYILARSRYGFAGGVKRLYLTGEGSLTRALLLMFAISIIGVAGVHFAAAQKGAVIASKAIEGDLIIPGSGFVSPADLTKVIGGILFGMGMMLGGGCASGTLSDSGEGAARAWITTLFFALGGVLGHGMLPWWNESIFASIGTTLYLPDAFGYLGTVIISLLILLGLYGFTQYYENKRRNQGTLIETVYEGTENPIAEAKEYKFFSNETYHKLFVERWSFAKGGVLIAMMFLFIMNTTGSSWGASGPYTLWGVWLLQKIGVTFSSPAFAGVVKSVESGLMNNAVSIRNVGIVFGAAIAFLLAGRFKFDFDFKLKDTVFYALGGLLMGYGAKVGGGCNVGALYSGIANFSLSGWLFMVSLIVGGMIALKIFEGKVNSIPAPVEKAK